nr:ATP-binding cassette domain-containing protein [Lachnospiraceae bacterium]
KYRYGHNVELGYFEQQMARYESSKTVFDEFKDAYPTLTDTAARNILGGFLFTGDDVFKELSMLSGGEKVRLTLAKIFQERPNLLLLDEPTNHVDIAGKEALEDMMRDFKGTLIFVSHDRYLVSRVADSLLIFTDGGVEYFPFDYEEYIRNRGRENLKNEEGVWRIGSRTQDEAPAVKEDRPERGANPGKERAKLERRFKRLEELMAECDERKAELSAELAAPENASDFVKLGEIQAAIDELDTKAAEYMEEWADIGEKLEA